jgi:DNA-binding IclR family transcriptional regulator
MPRPAPAADRAAAIVSFLTAHPSRGFTISELVEHLGMNIASAHATLAVLSDHGFVIRDPVHRTYTLGPALVATGFAALEQHRAIDAALEQAELLATQLEREVGLTAVAGRDVIFLARRGPDAPAATIGYPGDRTPLLAPIGAVFMAWAEDTAVDEWLARASLDDDAAESYRRVLVDIRSRGYSVPMRPLAGPEMADAISHLRDDPAAPGAEGHLADVLQSLPELLLHFDDLRPDEKVLYKTVSAPIFDPLGRVLLSLSVTGPEHPVPVEEVLQLGRRVARSAAVATRQARGRVPER